MDSETKAGGQLAVATGDEEGAGLVLDGDPSQPLPVLVAACLWSVPMGQRLMMRDIAEMLARAGRRTSVRRIAATLLEMDHHYESNPLVPVRVMVEGNHASLRPKSEVAGVLGHGFTIPRLSEDAMALLAAVIYWPHPKPPTRHHLQQIFAWSVESMDRVVQELIEANAVYVTRSYDHWARLRSTPTVLARLGVRDKSELPRWEEIRAALESGAGTDVDS